MGTVRRFPFIYASMGITIGAVVLLLYYIDQDWAGLTFFILMLAVYLLITFSEVQKWHRLLYKIIKDPLFFCHVLLVGVGILHQYRTFWSGLLSEILLMVTFILLGFSIHSLMRSIKEENKERE